MADAAATSNWVEETDFGTVEGHGLTLGRCASCGMPVMTVVEAGDGVGVSGLAHPRRGGPLPEAAATTPTG